MTDKYPRVEMGWTKDSKLRWVPSPTRGTHMVVPADAIVIERGDLAPVQVVDGWAECSGGEDPYRCRADANPGWPWQYGLNALAVSLYLSDHPDVDEAEAEAATLNDAMVSAGWPSDRNLARALVARGYRVTEATGASRA